ncbi:MAG: CAP domain-containing protein [Phycisphaerae bacterium]
MIPDWWRRLRASRLGLVALSVVIGATGCNTTPAGGLTGAGQDGAAGAGGSGGNSAGATPAVAASLLEQLSLERINRARLRPAQEAAADGIAVDEGIPGQLNTTPKPAVAMNATLRRAAKQHSDDMLNRNYFEHDTPEGVSPFDRMLDAGFAFIVAGENLSWRGTTGTLDPVETIETQHNDLFIDTGIAGRGHRVTMLNPQFREVGISIVRGSFTRSTDGLTFTDSIMQTQDYGTNPSDNPFILGVVYDDANGNGQYDHGEGVAGATVSLDDAVTSTNQAGGYSFEVMRAGAYTLRFASGATQALTIRFADPNLKVDLVDGSRIVVNLGLGPL